MAHADFVHLRVHSAYSLAEGALHLEELIARCRDLGMPAVAVTDSCNMFGALEFATAAAARGVQPIIGCQLHVGRPDGPAALAHASGGGNGNGHASNRGRGLDPDQLVLLVQSETGYRNLLGLVSRAYLNTEPGVAPQVAFDDLDGRTDGLIALTGGPAGAVGRLIAENRLSVAEATIRRLAGLFPDRLYIELMRHELPE